MDIRTAVIKLDELFLKYGIKNKTDVLGYRNNFMEYVKSLEGKDLQKEFNQKTFFYEFIKLQKDVGLSIDLLNNYTMVLAQSNRKLGQDFTPNSLLEVMSKLIIKDNGNVFYDCAGGTGSQLIKAYYEWLKNPKNFSNMYNAILEIDEYDLYNCYCCVFNFIIRGFNAIVRNKNTLTNETYMIFVMTNKFTYNEEFSWFSDYKTLRGEEMYEF